MSRCHCELWLRTRSWSMIRSRSLVVKQARLDLCQGRIRLALGCTSFNSSAHITPSLSMYRQLVHPTRMWPLCSAVVRATAAMGGSALRLSRASNGRSREIAWSDVSCGRCTSFFSVPSTKIRDRHRLETPTSLCPGLSRRYSMPCHVICVLIWRPDAFRPILGRGPLQSRSIIPAGPLLRACDSASQRSCSPSHRLNSRRCSIPCDR